MHAIDYVSQTSRHGSFHVGSGTDSTLKIPLMNGVFESQQVQILQKWISRQENKLGKSFQD